MRAIAWRILPVIVMVTAVPGVPRAGVATARAHRAGATPGAITIPARGARVTLPLHILARAGRPGQSIAAVLRWRDGTVLSHTFTALRNAHGAGLLIESLDWLTESRPPMPRTQPATLELRDDRGAVLARQQVTMLSADDPATRRIQLYWYGGAGGGPLYATQEHIPSTRRIATATLAALLWGPNPRNLAGFVTALPTPRQVLGYRARGSDWGARVTLRRLTIASGVATADFSPELAAYGGDPRQGQLIYRQVSRTLMQFPSVHTVRITIAGNAAGAPHA